MNGNLGLPGIKLGMTQLVAADGTVTPCTVVQVDAVVVGKRSLEKDGYDALIVGTGERRESLVTKPVLGQYKKAGLGVKRDLIEFRSTAEIVASYEIGAVLKAEELFDEGQFVDVRGVSKGRGFSGVMRRHNFKGGRGSHGAHEYKRHGGSIGSNMTPGRVLPGKKMPGQMGNANVTVVNQRIVKIVADKQLVLVRGGIPGARNCLVELRGAVKKRNGGKSVA